MMNELLVAIRNDNHAQIIEKLQNSNIDQPIWYGLNALLYAAVLNKQAVVQLLLKYGADVNYCVTFDEFDPVEPIDSDVVEEMIVNDPITEELIGSIQNLGNVTALHIAVKQNNFNLVNLLLQHNARTDIADQGGCTPLHWAVAQNQEAIIALLMRYNANPNILDLAGSSPIDEAKRRNFKDILQLLSSKPN